MTAECVLGILSEQTEEWFQLLGGRSSDPIIPIGFQFCHPHWAWLPDKFLDHFDGKRAPERCAAEIGSTYRACVRQKRGREPRHNVHPSRHRDTQKKTIGNFRHSSLPLNHKPPAEYVAGVHAGRSFLPFLYSQRCYGMQWSCRGASVSYIVTPQAAQFQTNSSAIGVMAT